MPNEIHLQKISSNETPRKIIAAHFKSLTEELPINGGWGYSKSDACIIDKNDPSVDSILPFHGIDVEYAFVEKRIYEEMIISRPDGKKFSGIQWDLQEQQLIHEEDRIYDRLIFKIAAFTEQDWKELKEEWDGPPGHQNEQFDAETHERNRQDKMVQLVREFWFEISSFYENPLHTDDNFNEEDTFNKIILILEEIRITNKFVDKCLNLLKQKKLYDTVNDDMSIQFLSMLIDKETKTLPLFESMMQNTGKCVMDVLRIITPKLK